MVVEFIRNKVRQKWVGKQIAVVGVAVILYFALATYHLAEPGLYYDEALDVVPAMQLILGQPLEQPRSISLLGLEWPIMVMDYMGATVTYLTIPFFWLFGVGTVAVRTATIFYGALTLVFTFLFCRNAFNKYVAVIALTFTATNPSFIMWHRMGNHVSSVMSFMTIGSLYFLFKWYHCRKSWQLAFAMLLLGLGVNTKINFLWFTGALVVVYALQLVSWRQLLKGHFSSGVFGLRYGSPLSVQEIVVGSVSVLVGAGMILWYNITTQGTIRVILANLQTTYLGTDNTNFVTNFTTRMRQFGTVLDGGGFWFLGGAYSNEVYIASFLIALVGCLLVIAARWHPEHGSRVTSVLIILSCLLAFSSFSIGGLSVHHLLILLPFPQIVIAIAVYAAFANLNAKAQAQRNLIRAIACFIVALAVGAVLVLDLVTVGRYHAALSRTGGVGNFSDAIYEVAHYVELRGISRPYAGDWGLRLNLQIITAGRVSPQEIFGYSTQVSSDFEQVAVKTLSQSDTVYLFHPEERASFKGRLAVLERIAKEQGLPLRLERTFYQRDGVPAILVYSTQPKQ